MSDYTAYIAILLAAGRGSRFDPTGKRDKLLQPLTHDCSVAVMSAANLLAIMPRVLAVVRPGANELRGELRAIGCETTVCVQAEQGMGASLSHAMRQAEDGAGWIIALADMPYVQPATVKMLLDALRSGAPIAVPTYKGQRGNPVAFSRVHLPHLLALSGDMGARRLLQSYPVQPVEVNDAGVLRDIDRPQDLPGRGVKPEL